MITCMGLAFGGKSWDTCIYGAGYRSTLMFIDDRKKWSRKRTFLTLLNQRHLDWNQRVIPLIPSCIRMSFPSSPVIHFAPRLPPCLPSLISEPPLPTLPSSRKCRFKQLHTKNPPSLLSAIIHSPPPTPSLPQQSLPDYCRRAPWPPLPSLHRPRNIPSRRLSP
jgi:hypothetical protein